MMGTLSDYQYSHERITINELDVAAGLLSEADRTRRIVVKYNALKVDKRVQADLAAIAIVQQQLGEALQEGRLVLVPPNPEPDLEWHILRGAFFDKGGKSIAGPFSTREDAFTARRALEEMPGGNSYYIDSRPLSVDADTKDSCV